MTASIALAQAAIALRKCLEAAVAADAGLALTRLPVQVVLLAHTPVVLAALPAAALPGNRIQLTLTGVAPDEALRAPGRGGSGSATPLALNVRYHVGIVAQSLLAAELMTGVVIETVHTNALLAIPSTAREAGDAALLAATGLDRATPVRLAIEAMPADGGLVLRLGPLRLAA